MMVASDPKSVFVTVTKNSLLRLELGLKMHLASSFEMCGAAEQVVGLAGCGCLTPCECPWPETSLCTWHSLCGWWLVQALNPLAPFSPDLEGGWVCVCVGGWRVGGAVV